MALKRFNSETFISNFGPHKPRNHDWYCPASLEADDGRRWRCTLAIRAGRTKHARAHNFELVRPAAESIRHD